MRAMVHSGDSQQDQPVNIMSWEMSDPRYNYSLSRSNKINLTVWDLKGGDKYDSIQTSLYTDKCLYLLVWDASSGIDSVDQLHSWTVEIKVRLLID